MNILDHFSESLETIFWVKNAYIFWGGSGSGIFLILDPESSNIPILQHWKKGWKEKKRTGLLWVDCRAENSLLQAATPIMKRAAPTLMPITPGTREYWMIYSCVVDSDPYVFGPPGSKIRKSVVRIPGSYQNVTDPQHWIL